MPPAGTSYMDWVIKKQTLIPTVLESGKTEVQVLVDALSGEHPRPCLSFARHLTWVQGAGSIPSPCV